jgi:hypothetical protein
LLARVLVVEDRPSSVWSNLKKGINTYEWN